MRNFSFVMAQQVNKNTFITNIAHLAKTRWKYWCWRRSTGTVNYPRMALPALTDNSWVVILGPQTTLQQRALNLWPSASDKLRLHTRTGHVLLCTTAAWNSITQLIEDGARVCTTRSWPQWDAVSNTHTHTNMRLELSGSSCWCFRPPRWGEVRSGARVFMPSGHTFTHTQI